VECICAGILVLNLNPMICRLVDHEGCYHSDLLITTTLAGTPTITAQRIAKEQKSVSLEKRAEATHAEYRRQKTSGSGGPGFRLPLW
jgi:hypothetical protein